MGRIEKTVFISYRRTDFPWELVIFQNLTQHGYDVFFDFLGIASGDFEEVILGNIKAGAHFLVLLTPSALERCGGPVDWLRREVETALDTQRNIVPLMLGGFDFGAPVIDSQLKGTLAALKRYNGLPVYPAYVMEAMDRLREKYLNVPLDTVLHPPSSAAGQAAKHEQLAAVNAPAVTEKELMEAGQPRYLLKPLDEQRWQTKRYLFGTSLTSGWLSIVTFLGFSCLAIGLLFNACKGVLAHTDSATSMWPIVVLLVLMGIAA